MFFFLWIHREQDPPSVCTRRIGPGEDERDPLESEEGGRQGARCWGLLGAKTAWFRFDQEGDMTSLSFYVSGLCFRFVMDDMTFYNCREV
jgi:hypothetical protein